MNLVTRLLLTLLVYPLITGSSFVFATGDASPRSKTETITIVVLGRTLTGPNSTGERIDGRTVIPIATVAHALGSTVTVSPQNRILMIQRQTGITALFDARIGQVIENGNAILTVSTSREWIIPPNAEALMLPVEIAAALFDVSIRFDPVENKIRISKAAQDTGVISSTDNRRMIEVYQAEYEYGFNKYVGTLAQTLMINATGRIGDGRFHLVSNSAGSYLRQFAPRNFSLVLDRPNGQRFIAGDFSPGSAVSLMTSNVRGGAATIPVGRFAITGFGGRANSGNAVLNTYYDELPTPVFRTKRRFDTNLTGGYIGSAVDRHSSPLMWAGGIMNYSGPGRKGMFTAGNVRYAGGRLQVQGDIGIGKFADTSNRNHRVEGTGGAVDLSATYNLAENLSVQGRYLSIGKNFLSPQAGFHEPMELRAAGASWSPTKWLSTSVNASSTNRRGPNGPSDRFVTSSFGITPGANKPRFYLSHTQSTSSLAGSGSFSLVNASKDFARWRLFVNATRIKSMGSTRSSVQAGVNINVNDRNSLDLSQGFGSGRNFNGMVDWRMSRILGDRLSFLVGGGYSFSPNGRTTVFERVTTSLRLPGRSSLNLSLVNTDCGPTVLVQLRGTLFRKRESPAYVNAPVSEIRKFGTISGRAFQDVDEDGVYTAGSDRPQAGVKVRIDGNRVVETDPNGVYHFEAVTEGDHKIYLDLLSVRADLTLLDRSALDLRITGGESTKFDFRLVRTGRITGRVWLDADQNGKFDEGEIPLADIRIVTASGHDTLTTADGYYTITDLAPGEHTVFIDEKTLPEMLIPAAKPTAAHVFAGMETSEVELSVIRLATEIKRFQPKAH